MREAERDSAAGSPSTSAGVALNKPSPSAPRKRKPKPFSPAAPDFSKLSPGLLPRQEALIRAYADPNSPTYLNGSASGRVAGYSDGSTAHGALNSRRVRGELHRILDRSGAKLELGARALAEGMEATKRTAFLWPKEGKVIYSKEFPDHRVRILAAEQMFKLRGLYVHRIEIPGLEQLAHEISAARRRAAQRAQDVVVEPEHNQPKELSD